MPQTRPLNEVAASLTGTQGTQGTAFSFSSADAAQPTWTVRTAHLVEANSAPYSLQLELVASSAQAAAVAMLGKDAKLSWERDGFTRCVQGIVTRVQDGDSQRDITHSHVTVEPALAALSHTTSSRIFEHQSILDVVKAVLLEKLEPFGRGVVLGTMEAEYPVREYIAQHRETDFDFVARLLAEHGLWYYFDHRPDEKVERLVITDSAKHAPAVAKDPDIRLSRDKETISQEAITSLGASDQLRATDVRIRYFDWTVPRLPIEVMKQAKDPAAASLVRYEHGDVTSLQYKEPQYGKDDSEAQAQLRLDAYRANRHSLTGTSNVVCLRPGHFMKVVDTEYLITSVTHHGDTALNTGYAGHHGDYRNRFTCVPRQQVYRPERRPKPRIQGPQTAIVVNGKGDKLVPHSGAEGSDISTDEHGRVRVKFHWDTTPTPEDKKKDKNSKVVSTTSGWIRVAQGWAGIGWGVQFIPRVGMEVIVHFIDGDPDRPIITGCVYNGQNRPPYRDKPTQSGIKTASSVDRERYNELRFDDTNGSEELLVKAQTTHTIQVGADRNKSVGGNQTETVTKNKTITVSGDHSETISGNYTTTIQKTESRTVVSDQTQTVNANQTEIIGGQAERTVGKSQKVTVAIGSTEIVGAKKSVMVGGMLSEKVGASRSSVVAGAWSAAAGASASLKSGKDAQIKAKKNVTVEAGETLTQKAKKWLVEIKEELGIKAKKGVIELEDELQIKCGSATITLKKSGDIEIKGAKINIKGSGDVAITGSKVAIK